jgi:hypothetical protein
MSRFIVYKPTPEDVAEAYRRSKHLGQLTTSFTKGNGNMTGFLGEVAFENTFKQFDYVGDNSFTHDYVYKGLKVDVKSKSCTSRPLLKYNASVVKTKYSKFGADVYFFMRVHDNLQKVWLCGWSPKKSIITKNRFNAKGTYDEDGFQFKADGYNIPIRKTRRPDSLESLLLRR